MKKNGYLILSIAIILVVVIIIMLNSNTANAPQQQSGNQTATTTIVIHYTPPASLPTETQQGSCWTNSIAAPYRADAWRCTVGNAIQDPCFETNTKGTLLCDVDPIQGKKGFQLILTKPLPPSDVPQQKPTNWAWAVTLHNGTSCTPFTGTRPFIDGQAGYYGCAGFSATSSIMLMGDLNNATPLWTATEATIQKNGTQWSITASSTATIQTVWQ